MAFKYRGSKRKVEDVARRSKESSGSYDNYFAPGTSRYKPREGENRVRIMPPPDFGGTEKGLKRQAAYQKKWGPNWEIMAFLHRNVGPDEATYLCVKHMNDEECPVCEARTEAEPDEADALRVQKRPFVWVIDRDNEKAGPQVWDMPMGIFRDINLRSVDRRSGALMYIDHPEEGFDIMFTREGTDKRTKYVAVEVERDPSPLHENERKMERWLEHINAHPLPSVLNFYDPDHIEKVLYGQAKKRDDDEDEDEEEETTTKRKKKRPARDDDDDDEDEKPRRRKKRKPADEDDEDDVDAEPEDDEDDEDEDEKPKRKKRRPADDDDEDEDDEDEKPRRKKKRPADDDEDEDEDDDDEDEKPARRKKRKPADDDEDDEDDEEEEKPARRRRRAADDDEDEDEDSPAAKRKLRRLKRKASK